MMHRLPAISNEERIYFYVPGYKPGFIEVASRTLATNVIYCLEDGTPENKKHEARFLVKAALREFIPAKPNLIVRINSVYTDHWQKDIEAIAQHPPLRIRVPMVNKPEDIALVDRHMQHMAEQIGLVDTPRYEVMIESREGLRNMQAIAGSCDRIYAFTLGAGDYYDDVKGLSDQPQNEVRKAKEIIARTCSDLGLHSFDSTYMDYRNLDGFYEDCLHSKSIGFSGRSVIHPDQVEIAVEVYGQSNKI